MCKMLTEKSGGWWGGLWVHSVLSVRFFCKLKNSQKKTRSINIFKWAFKNMRILKANQVLLLQNKG